MEVGAVFKWPLLEEVGPWVLAIPSRETEMAFPSVKCAGRGYRFSCWPECSKRIMAFGQSASCFSWWKWLGEKCWGQDQGINTCQTSYKACYGPWVRQLVFVFFVVYLKCMYRFVFLPWDALSVFVIGWDIALRGSMYLFSSYYAWPGPCTSTYNFVFRPTAFDCWFSLLDVTDHRSVRGRCVSAV